MANPFSPSYWEVWRVFSPRVKRQISGILITGGSLSICRVLTLCSPLLFAYPIQADQISLDSKVRSAVAGAANFLTKLAEEDEEGWIVPPKRTRKVIGHEVVMHKYREEMREIPVYEYEYEQYEVLQKVRVGESAEAVDTYRKVKKRRVVSRKQVGTKKVTRLIRDPQGSIEREHKVPKYGPGGADVWSRYSVGDNALALYAMRRAGVSYDEPTIHKLATNLENFLTDYGMPDDTWDLAWLTAAFATLPLDSHGKAAEALASKLMDGQLRDGPAAGLWGPVAIHTALLAEQVAGVNELATKFQDAKKAANNGKREQRTFQEIDEKYRAALADLNRVATFGMTGHTIEVHLSVNAQWVPSIKLAGLTDYIYNQRSADLGTTAVALYALAQAADHGTLPKQLWRPATSRIEAESPSRLISTSLKALASKLVEKRNWDEMNYFQAVDDFQRVKIFPGVPRADTPFPNLISATTPLSTAQGFSAMSAAHRIVASKPLQNKYRPHMAKGLELFRASAEGFLESETDQGSAVSPLAPYDQLLFLSEVTRRADSPKEDRRDLWEPLAARLLSLKTANGNWEIKGPGRRYHLPSSLMARIAAIEAPEKKARMEYDKPHVYQGYYTLASALVGKKKPRPTVEQVVPTAMAMVFLAENVRPPVIGECLWSPDTSDSRITPVITSVIRQQKGLTVRSSAVTCPLIGEQIAELPVLLIRGEGPFTPSEEEIQVLKDYLDAGGLVLFEATANPKGLKFLSDAKKLAKKILSAPASMEDIGSDKELMGPAVGQAKIQAIKQESGALAVVFLPLADTSGSNGLTIPVAARGVYNMLFQKLDPEILLETYPISTDTADSK